MDEDTVGIAELRRNLDRHLTRVREGHRIVITDHNRPLAVLGPPSSGSATIDRLIAEGRGTPGKRRGPLPPPIKLEGVEPGAVSKALEEMRNEERW